MMRNVSRRCRPERLLTPIAAVAALVVGTAADAHFLWLSAERRPEATVVLAFLSEPPVPDLPMFMKYIEDATYSAEGQELLAERGEETFILRLPEKAPRTIDGSCDLGVMSREGAAFRLLYTARAQLGPDRTGEPESGDGLRVRLIENEGGATSVEATFNGRPASGATVKAYLEDGTDQELIADDEGRIDCPGVAEGRVGLLVKWPDGIPGEHEGKPFDETRHYATLTVAFGEADDPTDRDQVKAEVSRVTRPFALLPVPINSFGGAVLGEWLYVYSGHTGTTHRYHTGTTNPHFYRLNLRDRSTWEELPSGPALQGVALVAHGDMLYRVGGMSAHNAEGEPHDLVSVADVARFDPASGEWTDLPPLPEPRSTHDAAVLGDHLYVVGGWSMTGGDSDGAYFLDDALRLDLKDPTSGWERLPDPPSTRRALAVAAHDGKVYVIGGLTEEGSTVRSVDVFDPGVGAWSSGPELPGEPMQGFAPSAFAASGRLFASGGNGTAYRLSETGDRWEAIGEQVVPRITHRLLPGIDGDLLVVGGNFAGVPVRFIESFSANGGSQGLEAISWSAALPGDVVKSPSFAVVGGQILVAGGNRHHDPHAFGEENLLAEAWRFRPDGSAAEPIASLPAPIQSGVLLSVAEGNRSTAYLLGGIGSDGELVRTLSDIWQLDPSGEQWSKAEASIPDSRGMFGATAQDGAVWIFGGSVWDPRTDAANRSMPLEIFRWEAGRDGATFEVTEHRLPRPRRSFAGASFEGKYYLVGGLGPDQKPVDVVDVFDFATGDWSTIPAPERPRLFADLVALGGKLYLGGGHAIGSTGHFEPDHSVEVYDPATGAWKTELEEVPIRANGIRLATMRGRLLLFGMDPEVAGRAMFSLLATGSGISDGPSAE